MSKLTRPNYAVRIFDAVSQLINVILLFGNANESISGRSYREGWTMLQGLIDTVVFWETDHCMKAHFTDTVRAHEWAARYPQPTEVTWKS